MPKPIGGIVVPSLSWRGVVARLMPARYPCVGDHPRAGLRAVRRPVLRRPAVPALARLRLRQGRRRAVPPPRRRLPVLHPRVAARVGHGRLHVLRVLRRRAARQPGRLRRRDVAGQRRRRCRDVRRLRGGPAAARDAGAARPGLRAGARPGADPVAGAGVRSHLRESRGDPRHRARPAGRAGRRGPARGEPLGPRRRAVVRRTRPGRPGPARPSTWPAPTCAVRC